MYLQRVSHRSILLYCYNNTRDKSHIKEVLTKSSFASYLGYEGIFANMDFVECHILDVQK